MTTQNTNTERKHTDREIQQQIESDNKTYLRISQLLKDFPNIRNEQRKKLLKKIEERRKTNYKEFREMKFIEMYI